MKYPNNQKLAPSLYKVDSSAGLTINFNQADLPVGPNLLPPPMVPVKDESSFLGDVTDPRISVACHNIVVNPDFSGNSTSNTRTSGQLRSRYVLPPQLSGTCTPIFPVTVSGIAPPPLIIPAPPPFVPPTVIPEPVGLNASSESLSATTFLPTPTNFNVSTPVSSITNTKFMQTTVLPTPYEFNTPSSSAFSSNQILSTPSFYDVSSSLNTSTIMPSQVQPSVQVYKPVKAHWFYATKLNGMSIWWPFDYCDSDRLETKATASGLLYPDTLSSGVLSSSGEASVAVPVRGGRYDVMLRERQCKAVFWEEDKSEVRRTTWLFRPQNEQRVLPFSEEMCTALEELYKQTLESNSWGRKCTLPSEENDSAVDTFIFYSPESVIQYRAYPFRSVAQVNRGLSSSSDLLAGSVDDESSELCILHRGLRTELASLVAAGDSRPIEHVVFVVHGIGSIYNMRGEGLIECVNDMRKTCETLMSTHFSASSGRVEFLPVRWHSALHSEATGINTQLRRVTLKSIPKLRNYTNGTLTDILFYTSPKYCQHIIDTVASSIISQRRLFVQRNPEFAGTFSIVGHSLGSVIVFDLLSHQRRILISSQASETELDARGGEGEADDDDWSLVEGSTTSQTPPDTTTLEENLREQLAKVNLSETQLNFVVKTMIANDSMTSNTTTAGGVGMPVVQYPQLGFPISACFLIGSPLPVFLTARGIDRLSYDFRLPNCPTFCNIFHPFDPVAYRMETMIVPDYKPCAVLMPHHKGRKRIHLEIKDNLARVGTDIKAKVYQSLRSTWRTLQEFASAHTAPSGQVPSEAEETEDETNAIKRVLSRLSDEVGGQSRGLRGTAGEEEDDEEKDETASFASQMNQGRRIDYVLQEAPLESLNDYLFALSSHATYWDSADCVLFILNAIFTATPSLSSKQQTLQRRETLTAALQGALRDQFTPDVGSSQSSLHDPSRNAVGYQEVPLTSPVITPTSNRLHSSVSTPMFRKPTIPVSIPPSDLPIPQSALYAYNQPQNSQKLVSPQTHQSRLLQPTSNHPPSQSSLSDVATEVNSCIPAFSSASSAGLVEVDLLTPTN